MKIGEIISNIKNKFGDVIGNLKDKIGNTITTTRNAARQLSPYKNTMPLFEGELHLFFHNFSGPGTHIQERLARGDKPVDKVDAISMIHDIAYMNAKTVHDIDDADTKFINAQKQIAQNDPNLYTKANAFLVQQIMTTKQKMERFGIADANKWITKS